MRILLLMIMTMITINVSGADLIPGYLKVKASVGSFHSDYLEHRTDIMKSHIGYEYGIFKGSYISPYTFGSFENTYRRRSLYYNYPFIDTYTVGFGIRIVDFFFIKYTHSCSHYVFSRRNEGPEYNFMREYQNDTYDRIDIGFEVTID